MPGSEELEGSRHARHIPVPRGLMASRSLHTYNPFGVGLIIWGDIKHHLNKYVILNLYGGKVKIRNYDGELIVRKGLSGKASPRK